jgi:hypothetical protein
LAVVVIGAPATLGAVCAPAGAATGVEVGPAGGLAWARIASTGGYGGGFQADIAGNLYVGGTSGFTGNVNLGADAGFDVDGTGYYQSYVAKFDATRHQQWIIDASGSTSGGLALSELDPTFGLAMTGYVTKPAGTTAPLTLTGPFNSASVTSDGDYDGLVVAADADGHLRWVQTVHGAMYEYTSDASFTSTGGIVAGGGYGYDAATVGQGPTAVVLPATTKRETWLAWFAADGSVIRAQATATTGYYTEQEGIAVAPDGSVTALNAVNGTAHLAPGQPSDQTFTSPAGTTGSVIASYDANGALSWVVPFTSAMTVFGSGIARDPSTGDLTAAVHFHGSVTIGTGPGAVTRTAPSSVPNTTLLVRLAPDGTLRWATVLGGTSDVLTADVATTPAGVAISGRYSGTVQAQPAIGGLPMATSGMFVASFTATGELRWFRVGAGTAHGISVAAGPGGTVLASAQADGETAIGDGRLTANGGGLVSTWYEDGATNVSGTVTDPLGAPVEGVRVSLFAAWPSWLPYHLAKTAPDGTFTFDNVPPGTYRMRFHDPSGTWRRTWWQASDAYKTSADLIVPITGAVQANQQLAAVNPGRVRGHLTRNGAPVTGASVWVGHGGAFVAGDRTGTNGYYDVTDLADGTYAVHVIVRVGYQILTYDTTAKISGGNVAVIDHDF